MKREKKKRNCGCVASRGRERERETELLRTELDMSESRYTDLITQRTSQANCCPCACMQMRGHHGLALPQTETSSMAGRNRKKKTKQKIRKNGQEKGFSNHRKQVRQSGNVQTDEKERERLYREIGQIRLLPDDKWIGGDPVSFQFLFVGR